MHLEESRTDAELAYLRERTSWLIRARWGIVLLVGVVIAAGVALGVLAHAAGPAIVVVVMALYNGACQWRDRRGPPGATVQALRRAIFVTLSLDVVCLAALLHWSDILENPFGMFYAFPMAVAAMLLSKRQALVLGAGACALHVGVVSGEYFGVLDHNELNLTGGVPRAVIDEAFSSPWFMVAHLSALGLLIFGVLVLVRGVVDRRLAAEHDRMEHERVALSRERLSHIGEISVGVAHSVRNPLHGLLNCVALLEAKLGDDPRAAEELEMMNEGLRRIESVTQRLLTLTRDAPVQIVPTDIDALVAESVRFVSARGKEKDLRLVTELGAVGQADVDPHRLGEALVNLLDNALYASERGRSVLVKTASSPDAEHVTLEVRDEGAGMTEAELARIFQPFFTTKPIGEGTGLGLAITKRIVDELGASIDVRSEPGRGTAFVLRLRRTRAPNEERS